MWTCALPENIKKTPHDKLGLNKTRIDLVRYGEGGEAKNVKGYWGFKERISAGLLG